MTLPPITATPDAVPLSREQTMSSVPPPSDTSSAIKTTSVPRGKQLEWYQQQLYDLLGDEAKDFISPKMVAKRVPRRAAGRRAKIRKIGGHVGADALWNAIRLESYKKLLDKDNSIPTDLKASYAAFVRECVSQRRKILATRGYLAQDDVPEMSRLTDQRPLQAVQTYRHRTQLMAKSSSSNENKSLVLLENNPLPVLSGDRHNNDKVILQYFCDELLVDDNLLPAEGLSARQQRDNAKASHAIVDDERALANLECVLGDKLTKDDKHKDANARLVADGGQQYVFLTEADCRCKGEFSKRRWDSEGKEVTNGVGGTSGLKGPSVPAYKVLPGLQRFNRNAMLAAAKGEAGTKEDEEHGAAYDWHQPLTLDALQDDDTLQTVRALGDGDFSRGRVPMWMT